jgi:hypothetical protein
MAQDHGMDLFGIKRETTVAVGFLLAMALEKPAFHEQFFAVYLNEIHGTGGGAGGAEKLDLHGLVWFERSTIPISRGKINFLVQKTIGQMPSFGYIAAHHEK